MTLLRAQPSLSLGARLDRVPALPWVWTVGLVATLLLTAWDHWSLAVLISIAICALSLYRLLSLAYRRKGGPCQYPFWAFVLVWGGFAPIVQIRDGVLPWPDIHETQLYAPAQLLLGVAVVSYLVGTAGDKSVVAGEADVPVDAPPNSIKRPWVIMLLLAPYALKGAGLAARFVSRNDFNTQLAETGVSYTGGQSVQLAFITLAPSAAATVVLYATTMRTRRLYAQNRILHPADIAVMVAAVLTVVIFANPFSSTRFVSFAAILACLFAAYSFRTRRSNLVLAVSLVGGLALVYPLASWFKSGTGGTTGPAVGLPAFETVDFDGFQQTVNSLYYVSVSGHTDGRLTLSALFFWVPRQIWSGKSLPGSFLVAGSRGYTFLNLSLGLWAEIYVDFGVPGVILIFFLLGRLSRNLDRAFRINPTTAMAAVGALFGAGEIGFLRGPLGATAPFFFSLLAFGAISYWRRKPGSVGDDVVGDQRRIRAAGRLDREARPGRLG